MDKHPLRVMLMPGREFIYAIRHRKTNRMYIGRTTRTLEGRIGAHLQDLRANKHSVEDMQKDFNEYGEDFEFYILDVVDTDPFNVQKREKDYMRKYRTYDKQYGYNYKDPMARGIIKDLMLEAMESEPAGEENAERLPAECNDFINQITKRDFKVKVKSRLAELGWNYFDLAEASGYTQRSICVIMGDESKLTDRAMSKFAEVLEIYV